MPKRRRGGTPATKRAEPKTTVTEAAEKGVSESHAKSSSSDAPIGAAGNTSSRPSNSRSSKRKATVRKSTGDTKRAAAADAKNGDTTVMTTDKTAPGVSAISDQATDGGDMAAADSGTSSSSSSDEHTQQCLQTLHRLDEEYIALDAMEAILRRDLNRLQQDEQRIRRAMQLSSETPAERREREARERDQKALEKLESALFDEDEDEEGDDGDGGDGDSNASGINSRAISAAKNRSEDSTSAAAAKNGIDDGKDDDTLGGISVSDLPAYI